MFFLYLITAFSLFLSAPSRAWREVGHFSVCEIAYKNLSPLAKINVDKILKGKSFAKQCTWPDMVRKSNEWKHTYDWHFVNVEDHQDYLTPDVLNKNGDVISAILSSIDQLKDKKKSLSDKKSALLFLGHFLGDIHQVVHIGRKSDLGGNKLLTLWFKEQDFDDIEHLRAEGVGACLGPYFKDKPTGECISVDQKRSPINLHKVWDLLMVDKFIKEKNIVSRNAYPYKEYVKVINKVSRSQVATWQDSFVLDWAQESLCYRPWLYRVGNKKLGEKYYRDNITTLNQRILMGGYRLAVTINRVFDPGFAKKYSHITNKDQSLLRAYKAIKESKTSDFHLSLRQCSTGVLELNR